MTLVLTILGLYALAGVLFAVPFALWGAARLDPVARHAPPQFRIAILPGAAALWPLLLRRWLTAPRAASAPAVPAPPEFSHRGQRLLHARVWSFWGVALLGAFLVLVALKPAPHGAALSTPSGPVSTPAFAPAPAPAPTPAPGAAP